MKNFLMRKLFLSLFFLSGLFCLKAEEVFANNLKISNVRLTEVNLAQGQALIKFDISWANSWRDATNYDAAWVFFKYSLDGGETWSHLTFPQAGTNPGFCDVGSGTAIEIVVPSDKKGCFIQRSSNGTGTTSTTGIVIPWEYAFDVPESAVLFSPSVRIRAYGLEMVYVPTANFYLGDGDGASESDNAFHVTNNTSFQITTSSTANVTVDSNTVDDLDTSPISIDGDGGITGNSSFPTGYSAFYLMKYEITEADWVGFFNTLTSAQKTNRDITNQYGKNADIESLRNTISWTSGDASTSRPNRAMNYLSWQDIAAFADWAALRPITELEYEKACRGTTAAVVGEFAWGTTSATNAATISGTENGTETISTVGANSNMGGSSEFTGGDASFGPLRVGIFSTGTSTRTQSGSGYYGNMELSGNLFELFVTIGNSAGRAFTGSNGDGVLTTTSSYEGNATNTDWPGIDSVSTRGVTSGNGSIPRGGCFLLYSIPVSGRTFAGINLSGRASVVGGRVGRSA